MKSADIREKFLLFFEGKGHQRVPSSSLVPGNDPTLLFTNSGMVQFKDVFLGFDKRPYTTAVTAQRCLRAGGKHNDLENVGYTGRHHTFFEMLGNFSFGDYFKKDAIPYAWEFLTAPTSNGGLGLKKEHLWVTVFGGGELFKEGKPVPPDEESEDIWIQTLMAAGFSEAEAKKRIKRIPTTDNFWMMGNTGPCGPCSEIFYDRDINAQEFRGEDEAFADECVEIWNLVFPQFNRDDSGSMSNLPAPCVDTGMGLERISAVMQSKTNNYEIDLFENLLKKINLTIENSGGPGLVSDPSNASHYQVIADHIRSAAFLIADGVIPSNEGRGYVLRRIIRRALRHGYGIFKGHQKTTFFHLLVEPLAEQMGEAYPILRKHQDKISETLRIEEVNFSEMLKNGMALLSKALPHLTPASDVSENKLSGDVAFKLYDTYGFPIDMTLDIAKEKGFIVDMDAYNRCMTKQQERSRAAMKFNVGQNAVNYDGVATEFVGYQFLKSNAVILSLSINGEVVKEAHPGDDVLIILDRTPFYAESGGQVGDTGEITNAHAKATVNDTQKIRADVWGHIATVKEGALKLGDIVHSAVDDYRRTNITYNHSAAHLMHAALRQVLGNHVEQRGSLVAPDHLRFDFSHNAPVTQEELRKVESIVNRQIRANHETDIASMSYDDAIQRGAMALFGEKYGDIVRTVTINPDFSVELCAGTHVRRAGDIGIFQFIGESSIAAGIRRVEAVTVPGALLRAQKTEKRVRDIAALMKTPIDRIEEKITRLRDSLKEAEKKLEELCHREEAALLNDLSAKAQQAGGIKVLVEKIPTADIKTLRNMAMQLKSRLAPAAILLVAEDNGRAIFAAAVTNAAKISAREWIQVATTNIGAKGGGKDDFAQAGDGDAEKIEQALQAARDYIANRCSSN